MINTTPNDTQQEDLTHRRKGGAFDMFARILRKINMIVFNTGTTMNDRPGIREAGGMSQDFVESQSVFEIFQQIIPKKNNFNFITIGKKANQEKTNTNYIDISVDSKSDETSVANGNVAFRLTRDGEQIYSSAKIALYETGNYPSLFPLGSGARAEITGQGSGGGSQLSYIQDDGTFLAVVVDGDGIQINKYSSTGAIIEGITIKNGIQIYPGLNASQLINSSVTLAKLSAGITPSHVIKYAGTASGGTTATRAYTITGVLSTDIVSCVIRASTNAVTIQKATLSNNTLTILFSGDPGANTTVDYQIVRAVS